MYPFLPICRVGHFNVDSFMLYHVRMNMEFEL
jgi:hypothetical protein